jgi:hypothetical protein
MGIFLAFLPLEGAAFRLLLPVDLFEETLDNIDASDRLEPDRVIRLEDALVEDRTAALGMVALRLS